MYSKAQVAAKHIINYGSIVGAIPQLIQLVVTVILSVELFGTGIFGLDMLLWLEGTVLVTCVFFAVGIWQTDRFTALDSRSPFWVEWFILVYSALSVLLSGLSYRHHYGTDQWQDRHEALATNTDLEAHTAFVSLCFQAVSFEGWNLVLCAVSHATHRENAKVSLLRARMLQQVSASVNQ